ncbi:hypothetical protein L7F22_010158 [Adiantum nelumboides]|nr:hypothetical protein [Adiantum nelumboides]
MRRVSYLLKKGRCQKAWFSGCTSTTPMSGNRSAEAKAPESPSSSARVPSSKHIQDLSIGIAAFQAARWLHTSCRSLLADKTNGASEWITTEGSSDLHDSKSGSDANPDLKSSPTRARNPVSWLSFCLLLVTGAGLIFYNVWEKKRRIEVNRPVTLDGLVKGMRDLKVKLANLEEKEQPLGPLSRPRQQAKEGFVHRCIWCDSIDHTRRDCDGFSDALRKDVVFSKNGKIHLRQTGLPLRTNFGKEGIQTFVEDMATNHATSSIEVATYGVKIESFRDSMSENDVDHGELWPNVMELAKKGKLTKKVLHEAGDCIRLEIGWNDPVDSMSVHAYITHCQNHEAIVEAKRRREKGHQKDLPEVEERMMQHLLEHH